MRWICFQAETSSKPAVQVIIEPWIDALREYPVIPRRSHLPDDYSDSYDELPATRRPPVQLFSGDVKQHIRDKYGRPQQFEISPDEEDVTEEKEVAHDERHDPPQRCFMHTKPVRETGARCENQPIGEGAAKTVTSD